MAARIWVVPAGRVRLAAHLEAGPEMSLRLLHTESHNRGEYPMQELSRRVGSEEGWREFLMPEGEVLSALYDRNKQEYRAISQPTLVLAGTVADVAPRPPQSGSDLLVVLEREQIVSNFARYDVELSLSAPDERRSPDVVVRAAQRLYAVWYGLHERLVTLEVTSPTVHLPPQEVVLRAGKVEFVSGQLKPLPMVDVRLDLPEVLRRRAMILTVLTLPEHDSVRRVELAPQARTVQLETLPAQALELLLDADPWSFRQRLDLSDGLDRSISFAPEPIVLSGTVTRGDSPHPAHLELSTELRRQQRRVVEEVGSDGLYEVILWRPGTFLARVWLPGINGPPLLEVINVPDTSSHRHDFELPAALHRVRIVDGETGDAIPGARLEIGNQPTNGQSTALIAESDRRGEVELATLRPGTVSLQASAEGYKQSKERFETVSDELPGEVTISLTRLGPTTRLCLALPDGRSALGAEIRAQRSLHDGGAAWQGKAGDDGCVEVPQETEELFLLARHPATAFGLRLGLQPDPDGTAAWVLQSPARSVSIQALDSSAEPAARAQIAFWVDRFSVRGPALAWLTFSRAAVTDRNGFWQGRNFPPTSLRVLAWMPSQNEFARAGGLDALAAELPAFSGSPYQIVVIE